MENSIGHKGCPMPHWNTTQAVGNSQSKTAPTRTTAPREADSLKDFFCITEKIHFAKQVSCLAV